VLLAPLVLGFLAAAPPDAGTTAALDLLGQRVLAQLSAARFEQPCSLAVEGAQAPLANALAARLSAELRPVEPASPDVRSAVKLQVALEGQILVVRGTVASTWVNFWSGAQARPPPPRPLAEVRVEADAAAIAVASGQPGPHVPAPRVPLALKVTPLAQLPQVPAALACKDTDGDGRAELAVLLPDAVLLVAHDGRALARFDFRGAPLAKMVAREPFGAVALTARPTRVAYFTARHEHGQTLEFDRGALKAQATTDPVAVLDGVQVRQAPGLNAFAGDVRLGDRPLALPAALQSVSASKSVRLFQLANGALLVARGDGATSLTLDSGAAAALADFDGDGAPELLTSAREAFPRLELLSVSSLADVERPNPEPGGAAAPLWRGPLSRGRALVAAGCDLNGDGKDEAVVGAWLDDGTGELSVVGGP
jgi:hypothetical protein